MCQEEIIKCLKKLKHPVSIIELMIMTNYKNRATVSTNCKRLRKFGEIKFKVVMNGKRKKYLYYI